MCVLVHWVQMPSIGLKRASDPLSWLEALVRLLRWVLGINSCTLEECYAHLKIWACSSGYSIHSACVGSGCSPQIITLSPDPQERDPSICIHAECRKRGLEWDRAWSGRVEAINVHGGKIRTSEGNSQSHFKCFSQPLTRNTPKHISRQFILKISSGIISRPKSNR